MTGRKRFIGARRKHFKKGACMAGYILKIVIENSHPPVWRRVVVPDKITFEELHKIIQILYDWEDTHLHEFSIPSLEVSIGSGEGYAQHHYAESTTVADEFLLGSKWIRYTYDFGDDWEHKILYEKTDAEYKKRSAALIKSKGDNFQENSGGIWGEDSRSPLDEARVNKRLSELVFSIHKSREHPLKELQQEAKAKELLNGILRQAVNLGSVAGRRVKSAAEDSSKMSKEISSWKIFWEAFAKENTVEKSRQSFQQLTLPFVTEEKVQTSGRKLEIAESTDTIADTLLLLNSQEAQDYCKYLQLQVPAQGEKGAMVNAVAAVFHIHPEYLLYVLYEEEWQELRTLADSLGNGAAVKIRCTDAIIKALGIGLMTFSTEGSGEIETGHLFFTQDGLELVRGMKKADQNQTYRVLHRISEEMKSFILVYGLIELNEFYQMLCKLYNWKNLEQSTFYRYVYWYARFNNLIHTVVAYDGKCYAGSTQLDLSHIIVDRERYAQNLPYAEYDKKELENRAESSGYDWMELIFTLFTKEYGMSKSQAECAIDSLYMDIKNGKGIHQIYTELVFASEKAELIPRCTLWSVIAGLMTDTELPMLKGYTRIAAAAVCNQSPWSFQMPEDQAASLQMGRQYPADMLLYEFPQEIQEKMFYAVSYAARDEMKELDEDRIKYQIQSEEFLCLLIQAYIVSAQFDEAYPLVNLLKKGSLQAARAARELEQHMSEYADVVMDDAEEDEDWRGSYGAKEEPYRRETPKIGRNDSCPCGSGKKYKHCCGR